jgi:hypothetical protein
MRAVFRVLAVDAVRKETMFGSDGPAMEVMSSVFEVGIVYFGV